MYNYTKILNSETLNLLEETIEIKNRNLVDITDILYKYQTLFKRMEILRTLNITTKLFLHSRSFKLDTRQKEAALAYMDILDNPDYQIDFHMFCELPRKKFMKYDPWEIMVQLEIYRDRVIQPAKALYPEFKKFIE